MVRTAAMVVPVLDPHGLLLSKAISLFHDPVPAPLAKHNLPIKSVITPMPNIGSANMTILTTAYVATDGLMRPRHPNRGIGAIQ